MTAIPPSRCPRCESQTVGVALETPYVLYLRCSSCGHVWNVPKSSRPPSPDDQVSISAYAENLLNKRYYRTLNTISADIFNTPYVRAERPGFYGVELGFRF